MQRILVGPNGIRAGWRMLIAVVLFTILQVAVAFLVTRIPAVRARAHAGADKNVMTPGTLPS